MWFLKVFGQLLRCVEWLATVILAGTAALLIGAAGCWGLAAGPEGAFMALSYLLAPWWVGGLLAAAAVLLLWRRLAAGGSRPGDPALPDPGPRWADRPGAQAPDAIRPGQAGVFEQPGPGAQRGEAP
jgi:hypothetical protein